MTNATCRSRSRWLAFMLIFAGLLPPPMSYGQDARSAKLIEEAKKEGTVMCYTSMNIEDAKKLADAFSAKYPFLRVEFFRSNSTKILHRVLTEVKTGRYLFDVMAVSGFETYQMIKSGLLQPYISPEARYYPELFKDPRGYWTDYFDSYAIIGYNTKLVLPAQAPKDWPDVLDAKWKGKLMMDAEDVRWYATILDRWGDEKGRSFMKALAKQDMPVRSGSSLIAQLVAAGEAPMGMVNVHTMEKMKDKGAPVDWVRTTDPIAVSLHPIALALKPVHTSAGKLFIDFVLSKEGQKVIVDMGRNSPRPGMDPRVDGSKLKLFPTRPELADRYPQYEQEYRQIFGR